jgi:hypothetical protein
MTLDVFGIVAILPANQPVDDSMQMVERGAVPKLYAFAGALERLVPKENRSDAFRSVVASLRAGYGNCGTAARRAVLCGADPEVVVATARLILT